MTLFVYSRRTRVRPSPFISIKCQKQQVRYFYSGFRKKKEKKKVRRTPLKSPASRFRRVAKGSSWTTDRPPSRIFAKSRTPIILAQFSYASFFGRSSRISKTRAKLSNRRGIQIFAIERNNETSILRRNLYLLRVHLFAVPSPLPSPPLCRVSPRPGRIRGASLRSVSLANIDTASRGIGLYTRTEDGYTGGAPN